MLDGSLGGGVDDWRAALRGARVGLRLSRAALAARTGVSVAAIRAYESGARRPSRRALEALIVALGLPAEHSTPILAGAGYVVDHTSLSRLRPLSRDELQAELDERTWPVFVVNQAFELVQVNSAFEAVFGRRLADRPLDERNLLAGMSDEEFAARVRNWDEVVTFMMGLVKGDPRLDGGFDSPLAWIGPVLDRFSAGNPGRIRRFVELWDAAEPVRSSMRYSYQIEWAAPDGTPLSFRGIAMLVDITHELDWNEWLPDDVVTWRWLAATAERADRASA
jgi:transcriptional regulator with XRE-family HTH domain